MQFNEENGVRCDTSVKAHYPPHLHTLQNVAYSTRPLPTNSTASSKQLAVTYTTVQVLAQIEESILSILTAPFYLSYVCFVNLSPFKPPHTSENELLFNCPHKHSQRALLLLLRSPTGTVSFNFSGQKLLCIRLRRMTSERPLIQWTETPCDSASNVTFMTRRDPQRPAEFWMGIERSNQLPPL